MSSLWDRLVQGASGVAEGVGNLGSAALNVVSDPGALVEGATGMRPGEIVDLLEWAQQNPGEAISGTAREISGDVSELVGDIRGRSEEDAARISAERRGERERAPRIDPDSDLIADTPQGDRVRADLMRRRADQRAEADRYQASTEAAREAGTAVQPEAPGGLETIGMHALGPLQDEAVGWFGGDAGAFRERRAEGARLNPADASAGSALYGAAETAALGPVARAVPGIAGAGSRFAAGAGLGAGSAYPNVAGGRDYEDWEAALEGLPRDIGESLAYGVLPEAVMDLIPSGVAAGVRSLKRTAPVAGARALGANPATRARIADQVFEGGDDAARRIVDQLERTGATTPDAMPVFPGEQSAGTAARRLNEFAEAGGQRLRGALDAGSTRRQFVAAPERIPVTQEGPPDFLGEAPSRTPVTLEAEMLSDGPPAGPPPVPRDAVVDSLYERLGRGVSREEIAAAMDRAQRELPETVGPLYRGESYGTSRMTRRPLDRSTSTSPEGAQGWGDVREYSVPRDDVYLRVDDLGAEGVGDPGEVVVSDRAIHPDRYAQPRQPRRVTLEGEEIGREAISAPRTVDEVVEFEQGVPRRSVDVAPAVDEYRRGVRGEVGFEAGDAALNELADRYAPVTEGRVTPSRAHDVLQGMDENISWNENLSGSWDRVDAARGAARRRLRSDIEGALERDAGPEVAADYSGGASDVTLARGLNPRSVVRGDPTKGDIAGVAGYAAGQAAGGRPIGGLGGGALMALLRGLGRGKDVIHYRALGAPQGGLTRGLNVAATGAGALGDMSRQSGLAPLVGSAVERGEQVADRVGGADVDASMYDVDPGQVELNEFKGSIYDLGDDEDVVIGDGR